MSRNISLAIKNQLASLPRSEQKVGQFVLDHPLEVIRMSAAKLAQAAQSSPASVIRFCHSIGLEGFTDLKLALSAQGEPALDSHYTDIEPNESLTRIKDKLAMNTKAVLSESNISLKNDTINQVVETLKASPTIYLYGLGASYLVALDFRQKFTRIGKQIVVSQDQHELAASLAIAPAGSTFIGISYSGEKSEGLHMMSLAKKWGLTTISLTKDSDNQLSRKADLALKTAETNEALLRSGATISLLSQLYAVDILLFYYMTKDYDNTIKQLELSKQAITDLENLIS